MSDDLTDKNPFADEEVVAEGNLISDAMVKKITYLIHKLAEQKGKEYRDIQKRCRSIFKYDNLAKVSKEQGHAIINKLIELTGGKEEDQTKTAKQETTKNEKGEAGELEAEIGNLAAALQICVGNSREIVSEELAKENITEGTKAILIKSFAATLFIEAMKRGLAR